MDRQAQTDTEIDKFVHKTRTHKSEGVEDSVTLSHEDVMLNSPCTYAGRAFMLTASQSFSLCEMGIIVSLPGSGCHECLHCDISLKARFCKKS